MLFNRRYLTVVCTVAFVASTALAAPQMEAKKDAVHKLVGKWEATDDDLKDKDGKPATIVVEFTKDGKLNIAMGPFDMKGTYKITKEEEKTIAIDTEMTLDGFPGKAQDGKQKMAFTIKFENADTIEMSPSNKKDPKTLKRKK